MEKVVTIINFSLCGLTDIASSPGLVYGVEGEEGLETS